MIHIDNVYSSAEHYLSSGLYNFAFRKALHSKNNTLYIRQFSMDYWKIISEDNYETEVI